MTPDPSRAPSAALAPGMIAAMPQLGDPNFHRSVVLLLKSGEQGAFGLVINREADLTLAELCENHGIAYRGEPDAAVMIGGPVERDRHLLVLHGGQPLFEGGSDEEMRLSDGVTLVTAREGLEHLAAEGTTPFRCYAGYAGWGPGQLERELELGAWVPLPCDADLVFDPEIDDVWAKALRRAGIDPISLVPPGGAS